MAPIVLSLSRSPITNDQRGYTDDLSVLGYAYLFPKVHRALSVSTESVLQKGGAGIVVVKRLVTNVRTGLYSSLFFFLLLDYSSQDTTINRAG